MSGATAGRPRWAEAMVGLIYVGFVGGLVALSVMVYNKDFSDVVRVTVRADHVGNALQKGSDVKVRGVVVGSVRSVSTDGSGADIRLDVSPGMARQLPRNVSAQLLPKTLFGERYVDLELPAHAVPGHLRSGDIIEQDHSAHAVELEGLFADLLPVLQDVQPEKLSATLGELAAALRGRGAQVAATIATVGDYLHKLAPSVPALTSDLAALASVAKTYTNAAPDLIAALDSLRVTSQTLVAERAQFASLITAVTTSANTLDGFVTANSATVISLARDSEPSLALLARYSSEFPCLSKALVAFIPIANKDFGVGSTQPGAHVILHVVPASSKYTTEDLPKYTSTAGPRCPVASAGRAATAPAHVSRLSAAASARSLGTANSPAENEVINELFAASAGTSPKDLPTWSSLLLGPTVRGASVTLR